jgi:hypothetical protein
MNSGGELSGISLFGGGLPMFRQPAIVLSVCCLLSGCGLLANNRSVSKPPQDEISARKWWEETVAHMDIGSLRCWYQAFEIHRQRASPCYAACA